MQINVTHRVLVVEDNKNALKILLIIIKKIGFRSILTAGSGIEAITLIRTQPIDLILCDVNMPNMNGLTLVKKIREMHICKNIPIIMITGEATKDMVLDLLRAGADDYILKPYSHKIIEGKIRGLYDRWENLENIREKIKKNSVEEMMNDIAGAINSNFGKKKSILDNTEDFIKILDDEDDLEMDVKL